MKKLKEKLSSLKWYRILSYCLIPVYMFLCLLTVEYLNARSFSGVFDVWKTPGTLPLSIIILSLVAFSVLFCSKKLWLYCAIFGPLTIILGLINCIKLAVNGDYFFPWDIFMAKNTGDLLSFARFDIPVFFWLLLLLHIGFFFVFWFANTDIPLKWYIRIPPVVAIMLTLIILYQFPAAVNKMLRPFGMSYKESNLQSRNYRTNGFINAFTINCYALKYEAPSDYSKEKIETYLANYQMTEGTEKPDVVVILSEAFTDIRNLNGTTFSQNPLVNYDEIIARENAASGMLYTTALGGGTVRSEFEVLTGLTVDYLTNTTSPYLYLKNDLESHVSLYRDQGYKTIGVHTYDGDFYMRRTAYPLIGFDQFIAAEEIYENYEYTENRGYITDDTFMNVVIDSLEKNQDSPTFVFGITMENHQVYKKLDEKDIIIDVENEAIDEEVLDSVETYTQGVYHADIALKKLVDYIDSREKPTVLLYFGDHHPSLGSYNAAYKMAGMIDENDNFDKDDLEFLYSTPYIVYSNYGADLEVFEDKDISTYYMLSLLADCTKTAKTPYMNYLLDNFKYLPKYNVRLETEVPEKMKEFVHSLELITYDRIK